MDGGALHRSGPVAVVAAPGGVLVLLLTTVLALALGLRVACLAQHLDDGSVARAGL
ncbi:hypothetical protein [Streptomyces sp. C11-1]|uniref:hypothetical protein n=1 Tax=Streptomyces sp. C11-1 TaxID=3444503 RepID=UPI0037D9C8FF